MKIVEDPRIAQVAKLEHDAMLAEIAERMAKGEDFFHARECVMAERGNDIARTYGKDVATRAMQALTSLDPRNLPIEVIAAQNRHLADKALEAADFTRGGSHRWTGLQHWRRENSNLFDRALVLAIGFIACSPIAGGISALVHGSLAEWLPAMIWSASIGAAAIGIMALADAVIGTKPRRIRGTEPTSREELEQQRDLIRNRWDHQAMQALLAQEQEAATAKREQMDQTGQARRLKLIADDLEISARQERRRHGLETDGDPVYVPSARRSYRRKAKG